MKTNPPPTLPPRDPEGHKGTIGTVAVVGGSATTDVRMSGAPALAATASLRAGAGLARLVMPEAVLATAMTIAPSATGFVLPVDGDGDPIAHECARVLDQVLEHCDCLAVGPGLGTSAGAEAISLRTLSQDAVPVVVDADAINSLARVREVGLDVRAPAVFTPHPGEYARLAEALSLVENPTGDEAARRSACEALARRLGAVVVLKGASTVVSDGARTCVHRAHVPALATAGTGDVLTGLIAGLIAQFVRLKDRPMLPAKPGYPLDLFDAARVGVAAHARAAARWCDEHKATGGMMAMELADCLPRTLEAMRG